MGGLGGEVLEQRSDARRHRPRPILALALVGAGAHQQGLVQADLLGAQERLLLGGIDRIEGLVGDARAAGDLGDREASQTLLGDDRRRRVNDPFALAADYLPAG